MVIYGFPLGFVIDCQPSLILFSNLPPTKEGGMFLPFTWDKKGNTVVLRVYNVTDDWFPINGVDVIWSAWAVIHFALKDFLLPHYFSCYY